LKLTLLFLSLIALKSYSQQIAKVKSDTLTYSLFNKKISILTHNFGDNPGINFLVLHDDENTGVQAAYEFMQVNGGRIVELEYGNVRYIEFKTKLPKVFKFDPNRIYSNVAIYESLMMRGGVSSREAIDSITKFADTLIKVYAGNKRPDYILTLHNNTDKNFSIASYTPGQYLEGVASEIYINLGMDPDDLILVTDKQYFDYLRERNINVVLQSEATKNDGSLSLYAAIAKIPYINIEIEHGHVEEHLRLIKVVNDMLKEVNIQAITGAVN
jgi:hypothetical protein